MRRIPSPPEQLRRFPADALRRLPLAGDVGEERRDDRPLELLVGHEADPFLPEELEEVPVCGDRLPDASQHLRLDEVVVEGRTHEPTGTGGGVPSTRNCAMTSSQPSTRGSSIQTKER